MAATPADAATVILLRNAEGTHKNRFEVLMVLRNSRSAFAPSAYVFPGGRVEEDDCSSDLVNFVGGKDVLGLQSILDGISTPQKSLGILIAAIRETFEEVGLLLARRRDGAPIFADPADTANLLQTLRQKMRRCELTFRQLLEEENLVPALDELYYFAHWITPELSPIRYDARFFVAAVPSRQQARPDGEELTRHVWITPEDALIRYRQNNFHMMVPTVVTLEELSGYATIDDVIESTKGKNITEILTRLVFDGQDIEEHTPDGRIFKNLLPPR